MLPSIFGEDLFDDFFGDPFEMMVPQSRNPLYGKHAKNLMKTDVRETEDSYELDIDLPGFKKDEIGIELKDGYLTLRRRKTGMPLSARVDGRAMQLLERYRNRDDTSPYLLCFLDGNLEGMAAYRDCQRILRLLNSRLRALALWKKVQGKVTSYSARHTWATVGRYCHIPIEVISEGLGHASVTTTEGYMKGFGNSRMDRANKVIMNYIFKG